MELPFQHLATSAHTPSIRLPSALAANPDLGAQAHALVPRPDHPGFASSSGLLLVPLPLLAAAHGRRLRRRRGVGLRVLSLLSGGSRGPKPSSAQRPDASLCYLHLLGQAEAALLETMQKRLPSIASSLGGAKLWGVDLEVRGEAADVVLLKFLRAADLDVDRAVERLENTLKYRAESAVDALLDQELPAHFQGHDTIQGLDVDGRPVMISRYGQMDNQLVFGDIEAFIRYRLQVMEKAMCRLKFTAGAPEDLCQVHDYSGVNLLFKTDEVKNAVASMTKVFSEHYPETKGRTVFVKFPALFSKLFQAFSVFIPEKTRRKFVILGDSDQALLFDYVPPEAVPEDMGGMLASPQATSRRLQGPCSRCSVEPRGSAEVKLMEVSSSSSTVSWELRVCSHEIAYELAFLPSNGGQEQIISSRDTSQPLLASEGVIRGEFAAQEAGVLRCRFSSNKGWFQSRLCLCRAEYVDARTV